MARSRCLVRRMMWNACTALVIAFAGAVATSPAQAAPIAVRGRVLAIKDPKPGVDPTARKIIIKAKQDGGVGAGLLDPRFGVARLRVVASGALGSDQTFILPGSGWELSAFGFKYSGAGAVSSATVKQSAAGTLTLKFILRGDRGEALDVVPPAPGSTGGARFVIVNGTSQEYDIAFGGASGGAVRNVGAKLFKVTKPIGTACPSSGAPCGGADYPSCGGDCPCGQECAPTSLFIGGTGCRCVGSDAVCPGGETIVAFATDYSNRQCIPPPTCFESTYPDCAGNAGGTSVCQAVKSLDDPAAYCFPVNAGALCSEVCAMLPGACPAGFVCAVSVGGAGQDCGCTPAE